MGEYANGRQSGGFVEASIQDAQNFIEHGYSAFLGKLPDFLPHRRPPGQLFSLISAWHLRHQRLQMMPPPPFACGLNGNPGFLG